MRVVNAMPLQWVRKLPATLWRALLSLAALVWQLVPGASALRNGLVAGQGE